MSSDANPKPLVHGRQSPRCPICSGPVYGETEASQRCRNSICVYNHRAARCPRCGGQHIKSAWFAGGRYYYSCSHCEKKWDQAS